MHTINESIIETLILNEGRISISKSSHDELMQCIKEVYPALEHWMTFTLRDLCGDDYWLSKSTGERRILGKYFAYLVDEDYVPFDFAYSPCGVTKRYRHNNLLNTNKNSVLGLTTLSNL